MTPFAAIFLTSLPTATASGWADYRDALTTVAALAPAASTPPEAERATEWQVGQRIVENHAATCAKLAQDEFDQHDCDGTLPDLRARAEAVLTAGVWFYDTLDVQLGKYDFASHAFPLVTAPMEANATQPRLCPGVVAGNWGFCLFTGQPRRLTITATVWIYGGPTQQQRTQLIGPWKPMSEPFDDTVAANARPGGDESYQAISVFKWAWSPKACVAETTTVAGYCWGALPASLTVRWPNGVRDAMRESPAALPPPPAAPVPSATTVPSVQPPEEPADPAADGYFEVITQNLKDANGPGARAAAQLFLTDYPNSERATEAKYRIAESYQNEGDFPDAVQAFQAVVDVGCDAHPK